MTARPGSLGEIEPASVGVDVASPLGEPEGELERGVAERARDRVPHLARLRQRAELDDQLRDRSSGASASAADRRGTQAGSSMQGHPGERSRPDLGRRRRVQTVNTSSAAERRNHRGRATRTGASARRVGPVARRTRRTSRARPPCSRTTTIDQVPAAPIASATPGSRRAGGGCAGSPGTRRRPGSQKSWPASESRRTRRVCRRPRAAARTRVERRPLGNARKRCTRRRCSRPRRARRA